MKKLFTIVITALLTGVMLQAQTAIRNEKMTHDADSVTVVFEVDTDMTDLPSNRKEVIFPYIYNEKDTLYLDVLEVYGKGKPTGRSGNRPSNKPNNKKPQNQKRGKKQW